MLLSPRIRKEPGFRLRSPLRGLAAQPSRRRRLSAPKLHTKLRLQPAAQR